MHITEKNWVKRYKYHMTKTDYAAIALIIIILSLLFTPSTFAQGIHTPGTGLISPTVKAENQGTGQGISITPSLSPTPTPSQIQERDRLQIYLQEQEQLQTQERDRLQDYQKTIYQDQDRTRLATQLLIHAQQTINGINPQIPTLANQIQNTLKTSLSAEEQIRTRAMLITFLFGGDKTAATQLQQITTQNQARTRQMQQLLQTCTCSQEVKTMLQNQIQIMQKEQERLQQVAQNELNTNGILSFLKGS